MNAEQLRLQEVREGKAAWRKWGPYLSERQWGTVREDYSESGDAWNYFSHDQARSRAYRWGEDGLGGISDDHQRLCFALALWNGKDPIIKERLFGLTNSEGNHGEDVKEYYFYLDSTPTHSYMKYLYKYPQRAYPYDDLVRTNKARSRDQREYELLDTGIFDGNRYFDVYLEYAKASDEDILVQISAVNRGPESADLHILPTLWFRNDWAGWIDRPSAKPALRQVKGPSGVCHVETTHPDLGNHHLYVEGTVPLLFSDNETNNAKLFPQYPNPSPYVKDGINDYIVQGKKQAVNPAGTGTKVSSHHKVSVAPGATATVRVRLSLKTIEKPFADFESILNSRKAEADDFFKGVTPSTVSPDAAAVLRQAVAGMLWSKQYYY
ncbi:MAG: glucosidase, partial [Elusimicrobia bacterium]|nr:glucosidase [Elusimicrobiota bacterium]